MNYLITLPTELQIKILHSSSVNVLREVIKSPILINPVVINEILS